MTDKSQTTEQKNVQHRSETVKPSGAPSLDESLSSLMDDRATEVEIHRILRATESDSRANVKATWSRYQMASRAMKGDMEATGVMDLSGAISNAIAEEETYKSTSNWMKSFGRFAVAASVAAVVVVTTQITGVDMQNQDAVIAEASVPQASPVFSLPAGYQAPTLSARTVSSHERISNVDTRRDAVTPVIEQQVQRVTSQPPSPQVQSYLLKVMEIHATNASQNTNLGLLPYARVPADLIQE